MKSFYDAIKLDDVTKQGYFIISAYLLLSFIGNVI